MTSYLSISDFISSLAKGILHRKSFLTLLSYKVLPMCSKDFSFSGFKFRSLIHLEHISMLGDRYGSYFIFLHVYIQFFQHQLLKILTMFLLLCQSSDDCSCEYLYLGLLYYFTVLYVFFCSLSYFYHYNSIIHLETRNDSPSGVILFVRDSFVYQNLFLFHMNFNFFSFELFSYLYPFHSLLLTSILPASTSSTIMTNSGNRKQQFYFWF